MIKRKDVACSQCRTKNPMPAMRSCKECRANYASIHYRLNKDGYFEKRDKWRAGNRESYLAQLRAYGKRRGTALKKAWRKTNPERNRENNIRSMYKARYGEFGPAKQELNKLVRQITGNPRSFSKV